MIFLALIMSSLKITELYYSYKLKKITNIIKVDEINETAEIEMIEDKNDVIIDIKNDMIKNDNVVNLSRIETKVYSDNISRLQQLSFLFLVTFYAPILALLSSAFPCVDSEKGKILLYDEKVSCETYRYTLMTAFCGVAIIIIGIGFPLYLFNIFRYLNENHMLYDNKIISKFGFF